MNRSKRTAKFKTEVVLELLRGTAIEELCRKYALSVSEVNSWRDMFITNGCDGFKRKPDQSKLSRAERKIGQLEMEFLGLRMSYAFVRSPQCNGCIERFNRTIEEEVLSVNTFETIQEAEKAIASFIESYNNTWIVHRLNLQSPIAFRKKYEKRVILV